MGLSLSHGPTACTHRPNAHRHIGGIYRYAYPPSLIPKWGVLHKLKLEKGDVVYLFSDGYHDQFGGPKEKKFMMKRFKQLLLDIHFKPMSQQKVLLQKTMDEWMGDTEQIDDILVMGVRF